MTAPARRRMSDVHLALLLGLLVGAAVGANLMFGLLRLFGML